MRLSSFFLLLVCMQVSARGYTQNYSLSFTNAPLDKVFSEVQKTTGYNFFYMAKSLEGTHAVSFQVKSADIQAILDLVFKDQPLVYKIQTANKSILVSRKEPTAETPQAPIQTPPNGDISGKVVNDKGIPEPGVSIFIKGSSTGTQTDEKGAFTLHDVPESATLVFSHVGFQVEEVKVRDHHEFLIKLRVAAQALADMQVLVSNGIFTLPKERATGSYDYIDNALVNRSVSPDILSRLNGVASGVLFDPNAGNSLNMQIRGMSTIQSNTQPLIILNDMEYDGDLLDINPNDIESFTILKDAAAASIWGVRAGNGVVVITTKKGHYREPLKIDLNANFTVTGKPNLFYDPNFLDATDFIGVETQLYKNGFYAGQLSDFSSPPISPVVSLLDSANKGLVSQAYANNLINAYKGMDIRNDLKKYFYRDQANQQYSLSLSGGSEKVNYLFSGGFDKNLASQVGNDYQRITLNTLNNYTPVKHLTLTLGVNYNQSMSDNDNTLGQLRTGGPYSLGVYPYAQLADAKGNALPFLKDFSTAFVTSEAPTYGFQNWQFLPLDELRNHYNTSTTKEYDARIYTGAKLNITNSLSVEGKYQYEFANTNGLTDATEQSYAARSTVNLYSTEDLATGNVTGLNVPLGGILGYSYNTLESQDFRAQLAYNKYWGQNSLQYVGGYDIRDVSTKGNTYNVYGYDPNSSTFSTINYVTAFYNYFGGGVIPSGLSLTGTDNRFRSYFSNLGYNYLGKYTFSASGRIDQSNLFGVNTNQKTVPLWSIGFKWDLDKENFFKSDWISLLKVRATYGYSGNVNNSIYAVPTASYNSQSGIYGSVRAANLHSPGDPDLTWEKSGMFNAGIDFGVLRNRIYGNLDYYRRSGKDLIGNEPIQASSGVTEVTGNYSDMSGNGVDLKLDAEIIKGPFSWTTELLGSYTANKVTKYLGQSSGTNYSIVVGKPVTGIYGLKWAGLDPATGDPRGYLNDTISKNYAAMYAQPLTGGDNKLVTSSSWVYKGPAQPTYFGGFRNTFSYKEFSLSVNITYKLGYYFNRYSINYYALVNTWAGNSDFTRRWQQPGDEKHTNVPSMPNLDNLDVSRDQFYAKSEVLIDKGDQVRLQDINLSYDLKKRLLRRTPAFRSLVIYSYINNVGLLWRANKDHLDPDMPSGIPTLRSISFGARFGF